MNRRWPVALEDPAHTASVTESDLRAFIADGKARRRARADLEWALACDRVREAIAFAADPKTPSFVGYYGRPDEEATRLVRWLVQRGRSEGRIE